MPVLVSLALLFAAPSLAGASAQTGDAAEQCETAAQSADWEAAVTHCEAALERNPDSIGIHYFLGFAHEALEHWAEAADSFEAFVTTAEATEDGGSRVADQLARAVRGAAIARFRSEDADAALPLLSRAAEADPADAEVSFLLGLAQLRTGDPEGAEAAFTSVRNRAPQVTQALFFLGQLRYDAGDYPAARIHLEDYLRADPAGPFRADAHWMAGSIALRTLDAPGDDPGDDVDADEATRTRAAHHFTALLDSEPASPRAAVAHYFLGSAAADREECETARDHYQRFLEIAPNDEKAPEVAQYLEGSLATCGAPPGSVTSC